MQAYCESSGLIGNDVQVPVTKKPLISPELQVLPTSAAVHRSIGGVCGRAVATAMMPKKEKMVNFIVDDLELFGCLELSAMDVAVWTVLTFKELRIS